MVKETKMANRRTFPRNSMNEKNREELKKSQWRCEHCAFRKAPIITERARERGRRTGRGYSRIQSNGYMYLVSFGIEYIYMCVLIYTYIYTYIRASTWLLDMDNF